MNTVVTIIFLLLLAIVNIVSKILYFFISGNRATNRVSRNQSDKRSTEQIYPRIRATK